MLDLAMKEKSFIGSVIHQHLKISPHLLKTYIDTKIL